MPVQISRSSTPKEKMSFAGCGSAAGVSSGILYTERSVSYDGGYSRKER